MKIRPVGAELFRADIPTEGHTDMMKLIVACRNFERVCHIKKSNVVEGGAFALYLYLLGYPNSFIQFH